MIKLNVSISSDREKLYKFIDLTNGMFVDSKLTPREMEILTEALLLDREKFRHSRFSRFAKAKIIKASKEVWNREYTGAGLNGCIYGILNKGYLYRDEDGIIYVHPLYEKISEEFINNGGTEVLLTFKDVR